MKLKITLEGKSYEVKVEMMEDELEVPPAETTLRRPPKHPAAPAPLPTTGRRRGKSDDKTCASPLAGVVVFVAVAPGQEVQKNATLVVLEAMKMETKMTAQVSGTVKAVHVAAGDAVKPGQVLVELE